MGSRPPPRPRLLRVAIRDAVMIRLTARLCEGKPGSFSAAASAAVSHALPSGTEILRCAPWPFIALPASCGRVAFPEAMPYLQERSYRTPCFACAMAMARNFDMRVRSVAMRSRLRAKTDLRMGPAPGQPPPHSIAQKCTTAKTHAAARVMVGIFPTDHRVRFAAEIPRESFHGTATAHDLQSLADGGIVRAARPSRNADFKVRGFVAVEQKLKPPSVHSSGHKAADCAIGLGRKVRS